MHGTAWAKICAARPPAAAGCLPAARRSLAAGRAEMQDLGTPVVQPIDVCATKANAKVAESHFKQATSGNVTAQIWWTKCRMRWKEPPAAVELSGRVDSTMEVVHARERVTRKLDTLAERITSRVAGLAAATGACCC